MTNKILQMMVILLKIILGFLLFAAGFLTREVFKDFSAVKKTEGYDMLSIWERLKFNFKFYFIVVSLISFSVFVIYFIIMPITIGSYV